MKVPNSMRFLCNEKGVVLVVTLMFMALLALLATTGSMMTNTDIYISSNYRNGSQAFYVAEAGAEAARNLLSQNIKSGATLSSILQARAGANGNISDPTVVSNLYMSGSFVTDDIPYIANTSFGSGRYVVYLANDLHDTGGITSKTDSNYQVTVTSFGFAPNNSFAWVQTVVRLMMPPDLPGAIAMSGPNVNFDGGSSNSQSIAGGSKPALAVNSTASYDSILSSGPPRADHYTGTPLATPSLQQSVFGSPWNSVTELQALYSSLISLADCIGTSCSLGTTPSPRIVVVNGDATFGGNGAGILLITGNAILNGDFSYDGMVLILGKGSLTRHGGGGGQIRGALFISNISGSDGIINTADDTFGTASYATTGGGNSDIIYDSAALSNSSILTRFTKRSWRQSGT